MSQHPIASHAVGEAVGQILERLGDQPDVVVLFATAAFAGTTDDIARAVRTLLRPRSMIGATAVSVLAGREDVEDRAAIALFAARFGDLRSDSEDDAGGGGRPKPRAVHLDPTTHGAQGSAAIIELAEPGDTLVVLADPFSFAVDDFIDDLSTAMPALPVVGGLASGASGPGGNRLVADAWVCDRGAVGLLLPSGTVARTVVSQGCRPIGEPLVVTRATGNLIEEIAGQPALDRLMALAGAASPEDRNLMTQGLHVGVVVDESKPTFEAGDFLIRAVLGADRRRKAVAVGAEVEVGSTVQFQVRDAASADTDLHHQLVDASGEGALVFTCTGRGRALFGQPHHDVEAVADHLDTDAVAGMFCDGEIGPVGNRTHLHGFTASVLVLADPT